MGSAGTKVERAPKGRKGRGKHLLGELPVRGTQRSEHVASAGVPKWALPALTISRGPPGSDLQEQRPSFRSEGRRGHLIRKANGGASRLTDPSLARSFTRRGWRLHGLEETPLRPLRPQASGTPGAPTHGYATLTHTQAARELSRSRPLALDSARDPRRVNSTPKRLGAGGSFIAPEDSSHTSAFREASGPSPSRPAGGEWRLLILPVG